MINNSNFDYILALSKKLESERLDREFNEIMQDEYDMDIDLQRKLKDGTYQFPNVSQTKTDKLILTRVQNQFSAKIHIARTPLYFHKHDFIEILYVYKGCCKQFVETLDNCIALQEGDLFILNQNVTHALLQEDENDILIKIVVPEAWITHEFIQKLDHKNPLFDFFVTAKSEQKEYYHYLQYHRCLGEVKTLIEKIMTEYYMELWHFEEVLKNYLQLLMIFLEREKEERDNVKSQLSHSSLQPRKIIQYIYEHCESVTLEELSQEFSFNQSYLSRGIKENCKMNFQDLVKECRLEKAVILLGNSNSSIEKIAQLVGYQNAAPIYKGIKDKYGVSPADYRKMYGKKRIDISSNE